MDIRRIFVTSFLVLALLLTEACNKKKPVLPPRSLAPTIGVELPNEIPEPTEAPPPVVAQVPEEPPPVKTKPKKPPKNTVKKTAPTPSTNSAAATPSTPASATNNTTVASLHATRNPADAAPDTAIAAALPSAEILKQKEKTSQIVDATENNLKNLTRTLSEEEKAMRSQIQSYLQQSRKATTDGDFERAYNLAQKAQLLAEALIKK
jgi:ElaB/YqjD/DUF883 family membrane-anchored ribosome-binding protein